MTHLRYTKDSGDISDREVVPVGFDFGDRNKVLCIDLSDYNGQELEKRKLIVEQLRKDYIKSIYASDLRGNFRSFFLDGIEEID